MDFFFNYYFLEQNHQGSFHSIGKKENTGQETNLVLMSLPTSVLYLVAHKVQWIAASTFWNHWISHSCWGILFYHDGWKIVSIERPCDSLYQIHIFTSLLQVTYSLPYLYGRNKGNVLRKAIFEKFGIFQYSIFTIHVLNLLMRNLRTYYCNIVEFCVYQSNRYFCFIIITPIFYISWPLRQCTKQLFHSLIFYSFILLYVTNVW